MRLNSYAISWLYGEFRIARFHHGKLVEQWEAPALVESGRDLIDALETASQHMEFDHGGELTVVHEHDLHRHEFLQIPTMGKRDLEKYLLRRVLENKSFDADAEWCYHEAKHRDGSEGVLLHLLPKSLVELTASSCVAMGLNPKRYVPLTEIISAYVPEREGDNDRLLLIVAGFSERTEIIVTLADGEVLLVRELSYGLGSGQNDRLVTDVNRTIRYSQQQVARSVDECWAMGEFSDSARADLERQVEVPVTFHEESRSHWFWAERGAQLKGRLSANFISVFGQQTMTGDKVKRLGALATIVVIAMAIGLTILVSGIVAHNRDQIDHVVSMNTGLRTEIETLDAAIRVATVRSKQLASLRANRFNLPSVFLLHLSDLTPSAVTLTNAVVDQSGQGWEVSIEGVVRGDLRTGVRDLDLFESSLAAPPWQLEVSESWKVSWLDQFEVGYSATDADVGFRIKGYLQ